MLVACLINSLSSFVYFIFERKEKAKTNSPIVAHTITPQKQNKTKQNKTKTRGISHRQKMHHHHHHHEADSSSLSSFTNFYQMVRPSPHSYIIMLSHISFFFCIRAAVQRRLLLESLALLLSCCISLFYHLCDENLYCAANLDIYAWHTADVWSTFFLICFVMGVMMLDLHSKLLKFLLRCCYLFFVTLFVWIDAGNLLLLGSLLLAVASSVIVRYTFFPPEERRRSGANKLDENEGGNSLTDKRRSSPQLTGFNSATPTKAIVNRNRRPIVVLEGGDTSALDGRGGGGGVAQNATITVGDGADDAGSAENEKKSCGDGAVRVKSFEQRQRERFLAISLGIFAFALACFVVANTPIVGPETFNPHAIALLSSSSSSSPSPADIEAVKKPMDVPDTAVYWLFHSVWHFSSAIAGYYMVRFMQD